MTSPSAPGGACHANSLNWAASTRSSRAVVSSTRAAFNVHTSGRNRPVASANPAPAPRGSAPGRADTRPRRADRHQPVARPQRDAQRGGGVVPGAYAQRRALGGGAGPLPWPQHGGQHRVVTERGGEQVPPILVGGRGVVPGPA